ncbi:hypothetical protein B0H17DRAFT_258575 [Mycena rosella]|uniref:Uncharacterized protein n=1 Tax=Mycena rosella TaxID=1033263 RepID=A0AAD7D004_MYCRO|nr:hypothetical protein B0H17DRAFT_258575 [Mycena rosella]
MFLACGSVLGLRSDSLSYSRTMVSEDQMAQPYAGKGAESATMLWRRAPQLNRLTTTTIVVGVIGGGAMVGALFLGILLVIRKQRERRKGRDAIQSSTVIGQNTAHFPANNSMAPMPDAFAPQSKERPYYVYQHLPAPVSPLNPEPLQLEPPRRADNMESAWFMDDSRQGEQTLRQNNPPQPAASRKVSREPSIPEEISTTRPRTTSQTRRSESDSRPGRPLPRPSPRNLPPPLPQPNHEPERPHSPTVLRQPEESQTPVIVSPRARQSSLPRIPRPTLVIPPPTAGRHVVSASEDIHPVSRFSISPVSRSFPSRLTLTGSPPSRNRSSRARHTRLQGFGSLSSLVHLRSDATIPDVPTDVAAI